jgi:hypothetical protein
MLIEYAGQSVYIVSPTMEFTMRLPTIAGVGIFLFVAGFFLLPAGFDVILYGFLQLTDGDYAKAIILMYAISIGLMFVGFALAGRRVNLGPLTVLRSPHFVIVVILVVVATFLVVLGGIGT